MYCPNCGCELSDDAHECNICGLHLNEAHSEEETENIQSSASTDNTEKHLDKKHKLWIIIGSVLLLVAVAFVCVYKSDWLSHSDKKITNTKKQTNKEKSTETKKDTSSDEVIKETEDDIALNINAYLGYWNITGNQDRELTIEKIEDQKVLFSLWYYRIGVLENITASLNGNTAEFSVDTEGIKGVLIFNTDSISVRIIESQKGYLPVEFMEFEERHLQSWADGNVSVDTYTYPDNFDSEIYTSDMNYIIPDSSSRILTIEDIYGLSENQLSLARNEIYARHGRIFSDPYLKNYFEAQSWYQGTIESENFSEDMLSEIEKANIRFIQSHE